MAERNWTRIGLVLVVATMAYNAVEAGLSVLWGYWAHSIALVGFGLDSVIELAAASVLLWRLGLEARGAPEEKVEEGERRVGRFVGVTFVALALFVTGQSGWILLRAKAPDETFVGIVIAAASLLVMPLVSWGKIRAAREIGSKALAAEARETLACSYLSFTLLVGLLANALWGWWWADPVAALLMVPWLVKEGVEGIRGEDDD
jgi:divalent metal cation (Fe/Co/Zn/Cd) transporter